MQILISALLVFALLLGTTRGPMRAQEQTPKRECGTVVTQEQLLVEQARAGREIAPLVPPAGRPYHLPLTIHIVRRSNGTGGFTLEQLDIAMQDLNRLWRPIGMQFYQRGPVDYINNDQHFNVADNDTARDALRQVNPVANTINVWFTNLAGLCGQARFTGDSTQGVLMDNNCAGVPDDPMTVAREDNPSTFAHEIGHTFDLYHTHETAFGVECPSGNNCSTAGDLLCDTPADPNLTSRVSAECVYDNSATSPVICRELWAYAPLTNNIMSSSLKTCRNTFTGNQDTRSLTILTTASNRSNLINVAKYVAPDGSLTSNCTYQSPCRTVARAVQIANPRDHIFFLSGTYPEQLPPINKEVVLQKWNTDGGPAVISQ